MTTNRLLAKSYDRKKWPNDPPAFALLTQHSRDVAESALGLVDQMGAVALANAGLPSSLFPRLRQAVVLGSRRRIGYGVFVKEGGSRTDG